jgi:hypothetical protein
MPFINTNSVLLRAACRDRANYVNITSVQLLLPQPEYDALLSALGQSGGRPSDIHVDFDDGAQFVIRSTDNRLACSAFRASGQVTSCVCMCLVL